MNLNEALCIKCNFRATCHNCRMCNFVFKGKLKNQAYNKENEPISILKKDGEIENLVDSSDQLQVKALSKSVIKYYICFPKVLLDI